MKNYFRKLLGLASGKEPQQLQVMAGHLGFRDWAEVVAAAEQEIADDALPATVAARDLKAKALELLEQAELQERQAKEATQARDSERLLVERLEQRITELRGQLAGMDKTVANLEDVAARQLATPEDSSRGVSSFESALTFIARADALTRCLTRAIALLEKELADSRARLESFSR